MSFRKRFLSTFFILFLILVSVLTRFYKLDWGDGYFFHPDESNMAVALSQLSPKNLNPHFFAYGQFPLYIGYFILQLSHLPNTYTNSIYILRLLSAAYSLLSIFIFYKISRKLFTGYKFLILLFIFCPGLIQISHFGTTESLLVLVFMLNIYLSFLYLDSSKLIFILIAALVSGIGLASKISALVFIFPIYLVLLLKFIKTRHFLKIFVSGLIFIFLTLFWGLVLSPYNLLEHQNFLSSMRYETAVASGITPVFYTNQFVNTIPYLFQFIHIFPYVYGLPVFLLGIIGFILLLPAIKHNRYWQIILFSSFFYFAYFGQLYVKWTRFMSPIFFLSPLLAGYLISKIKSKKLQLLTIIVCCLPGIYFMKLYLNPDIRLKASDWLISNVSAKSQILSEGGNVVDIPLGEYQFKVNNYDFYNYQPINLAKSIADSEYILVPSRRVFRNFDYPYYRHLFDGSLGFVKIKSILPDVDLLLNPENAEETWSVFDHPTIRVYKKIKSQDTYHYSRLTGSDFVNTP